MLQFLAISEWVKVAVEVEAVAEDRAAVWEEVDPFDDNTGTDNMRCKNESMRSNAW